MLTVLGAGVILLGVLSSTFMWLVMRLSSLLQWMPYGHGEGWVLPLLVGGVTLILVRGQGTVTRYRRLRRRMGLVSGHWTDHILALPYILALFVGVASVATFVAWGAALLLGTLVT